MTMRSVRSLPSRNSTEAARQEARQRRRQLRRQMLLESLEQRNLMAVGPQLIGVQPNLGDLLKNASLGDGQYDLSDVGQITVLNEAPNTLRLSFDESQVFPTAGVRGIQVTRAGSDKKLGTSDDVTVVRSDLNGFTGYIGGDAVPNRNVVILRFPETLPDDLYRVEIFGADVPSQSIVGLRNSTNDLFVPETAGATSQKLDFKLSLGAQVTAIVPQPVERVSGVLTQRGDRIDVYFNDDKLFPNAVKTGDLTPNPSVVRPEFYQLILTQGTVRNTDDLVFNPTSVSYDPATNSARLTFASSLQNLINPNTLQPIGYGTFRMRIGTNELTPTNPFPETPTHLTPKATGRTDFGSAGAVVMDFTAVQDFGESPRINFVLGNLGAGVLPAIQVDGQQITVTLNLNGPSTAADVRTAINANPLSSALVTASIDPVTGGNPLTVLAAPGASYASVKLTGIGSSFATATDVGNLASANFQNQILSSSILDTQSFTLNFPSTQNEPGHRDLPDGAGHDNEQHVVPSFGYDTTAGPRTIAYNFKTNYGVDPLGNQLSNDIQPEQKQRVREALEIWANYIGVQFVETADQGITFATGDTQALNTAAPDVRSSGNSVARVDPSFLGTTIILSKTTTWNNTFGQSYFQEVMNDVGWALGLGNDAELPASNELVFPNDQDVIHGQLLERPDSNDVDMYRFTIDLEEGKTGSLTAQTFAERQADSSLLDTVLRLYRQTESQAATVSTDFNSGNAVRLRFTATTAGRRGNDLQLTFVQNDAIGATVQVVVVDDVINVTLGSGVTAQDLLSAINNDPDAGALVQGVKESGDETTVLSTIPINYSPLGFSGGLDQSQELIASNDDYFSKDSLLRLDLGRGTYYLGVSAKGNQAYDPAIENTGFGGRTSGKYDLQLNFRPQVDFDDAIRDQDRANEGVPGTPLDGDGDGIAGGVYDFWFQTQNLQRVLEVTGGGAAFTDGQILTVTNFNGTVRRFEFNSAGGVGSGNVAVNFTGGSTPAQIATALANAMNGATGFNTAFAQANGAKVTLSGDRSVVPSASLTAIKLHGKTIFVDKSAGPLADGSAARPFNNIASSTVTNAFANAIPGDLVRIVGNGGTDGNLATVNDTFAYEIGFGTLPGQILSDGTTMEVPKGVTVMVDAGAVFKLLSARIGVGSYSLGVDRSQGTLQVLGTPQQSVYFTSWLDESIGRDTFPSTTTTPGKGNWGGIAFKSDLDHQKGQFDLESQGIFLNYVNHADIRYGGGIVNVDSTQLVIQPIQMTESRPTVTYNTIRVSADSALSADPDSFAETDFNDPAYQRSGEFTPDYDRVGPEIHGNRLLNNSINGLFVRIGTATGSATKILNKAGRFDDTDVVHYLAENLEVHGTPGGPILETSVPAVNLVSLAPQSAGSLPVGTYRYRFTFVDSSGYEGLPSAASSSATLATTGAIKLANLPQATGSYVARRLYRSDDGVNYKLITQLNANDQTYVDDDTNRTFLNLSSPSAGTLDTSKTSLDRPRLDASLVIDPGTVVKLEGARFETTFGAQFTAEGLVGQEVIFTSNSDDRFGAGGTFDTNNDDTSAAERAPAAGDWGGIYLGHTSGGSIDHALLAFGGGVTKIEGTFTGFNVLEVHQAEMRLAHSALENNASGMGGQASADRLGRMTHAAATVFVRGAQPVVLDNVIRNNASDAIQIDLNSLNGFLQGDPGRQTGEIDRQALYDDNRGPLVRDNRLSNNGLNALVVRPGTLAVEGVWDDTDIAHVVGGTVTIPNFHTYGGLRLQSSPTESLVVKFNGGGITATGTALDIDDRIGGMLHIVGQPGYPVVLTSLPDDTVGAGLQPDGTPMLDTNNSANPLIGSAGDWAGLLLDRYSHDRNLDVILETELVDATAPGTNASPLTAQALGNLAPTIDSGDGDLRLGFTVHGYINDIHDVDTYSFTGTAGTEVWFDVDRTDQSLDSILEVLNADGVVVARSNDSAAEAADPSLLYVDPTIPRNQVNPLPVLSSDDDFWTLNVHDAGMRVVLPGTPGARSTFFFRIRSAGENLNLTDDGTTDGAYDVQVRLRAKDELPGSTIRYADVRYAVNGIRTLGLPAHSPFVGEIAEDEEQSNGDPDSNDVFIEDVNVPGIRPQDIGNLLATDQGTLSIAGSLSSANDLDVFSMGVNYVSVGAINSPPLTVPTVFDVDYADGLTRPDTTVSVFDSSGRLILIGRDSNILDDQPRPLNGNDMADLGRGSAGRYDAFIGPVALPVSQDYFTVVSSGGRIPDELVSNPLVRLEPIDSVTRIAEDHIGSSGGSTAFPPVVPVLLDPSFVGAGANLWHVTNRRASDPGHGLTPAFDGSRVAGAGTVTEQEPNDSLAGASNLDGAQWSLVFDANVGDSLVNTSTTIPHVRINATGNGTFDYYKFTVSAAGLRGIFDIDGAQTGQPGTIDTQLFLYDLAGNLLASNDTSLASNGAGGSVSPLDAYLEHTFAAAGTYVLGVGESLSTGAVGGITGNPPDSGDQYTLNISVEGHSLPPINTGGGQSFYFGREVFGDYNTGIRAVGSLLSNPFNLGGYSAADLPKVYFNYFLDTDGFTDRFRVYAQPAVGVETLIASSLAADLLGTNVVPLVNGAGGWLQARVPLDSIAGLDGVRLRFEFDSVNGLFNSFEGAYLDDVIIGFAERGEMVTNAGVNTAYADAPGGAGSSVTSGDYQLEIRRGEVFGTAQIANPNSLRLDSNFDTNDRLTRQTTVTLPAGASLTDTSTFVVGDGVNQLTFEFDSNGSVSPGHVAVAFTPGDSAGKVAATFRDVVNSQSVQGVLSLQATSASGTTSGTNNDARVALHGKAVVTAGTSGVGVVSFDNTGDSNVPRQQGQVLIQSSYVTEARDFGIWVDAGARDPDADGNILLGPAHPGSVRNLASENDDPPGGLTPGVVIENNVISGDMAGGVHVSGDAPAYEIVTRRPQAYPVQNLVFQTAGDAVCDGDAFTVNSYRLSVTFEFEDIAGAPTFDGNTLCPIGSGTAGGNGWTATRIPIFYRRSLPNNPGFTQAQMAAAINTAFNGSILANNATTLVASSFVAGSRRFGGVTGPDPAVYLDHASQVFAVPQPGPRGPGYRLARISPVERGPQPFARVVNNTIYGNDGQWAFFPEANVDTAASPNDTLMQAIDTHQGRQAYPQSYVTSAAIGDGPFFRTDRSVDVDFYQFQAIAGDRVLIDVDSNQLNGILRLFDAAGNEVAFNDNAAAPGETLGLDPFLDFTPSVSGTYYVAVSGSGNRNYDPLSLGSRTAGGTTGAYDLSLTVRSPRNWYVNVDGIYASGANFTMTNRTNTVNVSLGGVGMPPGPPQFASNLANAINASGLAGVSASVVGQNYVLIRGAVNVTGLGGVVPGPGENRHHVIQQEGIYLSEQSSPTMLNNILVNHQNGLFQSQNSTTPNFVAISPFTAIEAASVYQFNGANSSITSSGNDFNAGVGTNVQLFENAPNRNFYPAVNSPIIDSAIDTLQDRDIFLNDVKQPMGLGASPILSPTRDLLGQLRIDDPNYDSPLAQGADVFKDRGALDRADFVDPRAVLVLPQDNDALGVDADPSETYVRLLDGTYGQFTILIRDGFTADNPFPGASVVDSTLLTSPKTDVEGSRTLSLTGPAVTVFQDGKLLLEGFDYRYRYDSISNSIQIIALAGVWPQGSVFEVKLNNRDRYVIDAPGGNQISDGSTFTVTDDTGARVTFEYESGYRLVVGPTLAFQVPVAGTGANGISDGQKFTINDGKKIVVFEFDSNGSIAGTSRRVAFANGDTVDQLAQAIVGAINLAVTQGALDGLQPRNLGQGLVHVGATPSTSTSVTSSSLTANVAQYPTGLVIPAAGIGPGGIVDGERFVITNGAATNTFEFDNNATITAGAVAIPFLATDTLDDLGNTIALQINSTMPALGAVNLGKGVVSFTTPTTANTVDVSQTKLVRTMFIGGVNDAETFSITRTGQSATVFEFQKDAAFTDADNDTIPDNHLITIVAGDTQDDIANKIVAAIESNASYLDPIHFGKGNIQVDDATDGSPFIDYVLDASAAPTLTLTGAPSVQPGTTLQLPVSAALEVPAGGGAAIADGEKFTVTNLGVTVVFEFDNNGVFQDLDNDSNPDNQIVPFTVLDTQDVVANTLVTALGGAGLGLVPQNFGSGVVSLGGGTTATIDLDYLGLGSSLTQDTYLRGLTDGDWFAIDDGTRTQTFEFENSLLGNGVVAGRTPIFFAPRDRADVVANSTAAVLVSSGLCTNDGLKCLTGAANLGGGRVLLGDSGRHITTLRPVTALSLSGVPAGSVKIPFQPDASFSDSELAAFVIDAIDGATTDGKLTNVSSSSRGGSTLFVDFQTAAGGKVDFTQSTSSIAGVNNFFLRAIQDLAGNELRTNRASGETQFTILMPGVTLDYGDAPDPFTGPGRYPTLAANDGARHTIGRNVDGSLKAPILGAFIDADGDGQAGAPAQGDDTDSSIDLTNSPGLSLSGSPGDFTITVGDAGSGVPNVADAQTFVIFDGTNTATIEFDSNLSVTDGRTVVVLVPGQTISQVGSAIAAAINRTGISVRAIDLGAGQIRVLTDDEDGVTFNGLFNEYLDTPIDVTVTAPAGWEGEQFLDGWIDYNQDGDWDDPGEQVFASRSVNPGVNSLSIRVLAGATPGQTIARFRLSTEGSLLPTGLAVGGEVEDYRLTILPGVPPVAVDDPTTANVPLYTTTEDSSFSVSALEGLIGNDSDVDTPLASLQVSEINGVASAVGNLFTLPSGATLQVAADGSFNYDPTTSATLNALAEGVVATDTFTYRLTDGVLPSGLATVTITVNGVNDAPAAAADQYTTDEDTVTSGLNLMTDNTGSGVDTDADTGAFPGTVSTLRLTRVNGALLSGTGNVTVTLASGAQVVARYNSTTGQFDGAFDYDPRSSASLQALTQAGLPGTDIFTYEIADSLGATSIGTVTMTVTGVNDAPVPRPNTYATDEDTTLASVNMVTNDTGAGADFDPDTGETASLTVGQINGAAITLNTPITLPSGSTLTLTSAGGNFTYTPGPAFNALAQGSTQNDTFTYTLVDLHGAAAIGTVTVTVGGVNDAPTAQTNIYGTDENTPLTGRNMIANNTGTGVDTDPDTGDVLSLNTINGTAVTGTANVVRTLPSGATLTLLYNSTLGRFDGQYTYDASTSSTLNALNVGQTGQDTFTYSIHDALNVASNVTTVTLTVAGANDTPTATPNSYVTNEDTALTGVTAVNVITDPTADSDPDTGDTALLNVVAVNGVSGNVGATITTGKGAALRISSNGAMTYDPTGSATLQALAQGGQTTDTFTYTVSDNRGGTSTATITVTVNGLNDAPIARVNSYTTDDNTSLAGKNVITDPTADSDPDTGETASLVVSAVNGSPAGVGVAVSSTKGANVTIDANGALVYDPTVSATLNALQVGQSTTDTFTYTIKDANNATSTATVTITVQGANDAPQARNNSYSVSENATLTGQNVITDAPADTDPDAGDTLRVSAINGVTASVGTTITTGAGATLQITSTGALTYNPLGSAQINALTTGQTLTETFVYTLADARNATSTATVTITVNGVNDAPTANNDSVTMIQATTTTINVLANDTDPEGPLTVPGAVVAQVVGSGPTHGTLTPLANGSFTYTPNTSTGPGVPDYTGPDSFQYRVTDSQGATSAIATVSINVTPVPSPYQNPNNALDVNADTFISPIDALIIINFLNETQQPNPTPPEPSPYLDTNGDRFASPADALLVINELNGVSGGEGEGEGAGAEVFVGLAAVPTDWGASAVYADHRWPVQQAAPAAAAPVSRTALVDAVVIAATVLADDPATSEWGEDWLNGSDGSEEATDDVWAEWGATS